MWLGLKGILVFLNKAKYHEIKRAINVILTIHIISLFSHNVNNAPNPLISQLMLASCHKITKSITTFFFFIFLHWRKHEICRNSNNTIVIHFYLHESGPTIVPTLIKTCKHSPKLTLNPIHTIALLSYSKKSVLFFF